MGGDLLVVTLPLFSSRCRAEKAAIAPAFLVIQTHSAGHEFSGLPPLFSQIAIIILLNSTIQSAVNRLNRLILSSHVQTINSECSRLTFQQAHQLTFFRQISKMKQYVSGRKKAHHCTLLTNPAASRHTSFSASAATTAPAPQTSRLFSPPSALRLMTSVSRSSFPSSRARTSTR